MDPMEPAAFLAPRLTSRAVATLAAIAAAPTEDTPRLMLRDELMDSGTWDWPTVRAIILDKPECDGRRLLAATWFEEQGEGERAEFVRVQVELERMDEAGEGQMPDDGHTCFQSPCLICESIERYRRLQDREQGLLLTISDAPGLPTNWVIWAKPTNAGYLMNVYAETPLSPPNTTATFRRGWIDEVSITAADWLAHGDAILAEHPVTEVRLTTMPAMEATDALFSTRKARLVGRETWHDWKSLSVRPTELRPGTGSVVTPSLIRAEWPRVKVWHFPEPYADGGLAMRDLHNRGRSQPVLSSRLGRPTL